METPKEPGSGRTKLKKAIILYNSRTGTTRKLGENIHAFLTENNIVSEIRDIKEQQGQALNNADYVFLGCWTSGLLFIGQKPEKNWVRFAAGLPPLESRRTVLFTTYKIRTGSMFRNMAKCLNLVGVTDEVTWLESRNGALPASYRDQLAKVINGNSCVTEQSH